ncbi:hypothetical protein BDN67DRAFT_975830 [Paxillus ammoniavirescens]|nr:hypothetical protein BDN67DRAFT_975830 [Paxillus ammoniavirescens]
MISCPGSYPFPLQDCINKPGTLYVRGEYPPPGQSGFNAQQFPQYPLKGGAELPGATSVAGRVVIDFWNQQRITAVFKTNAENYISGGTGTWFQINN